MATAATLTISLLAGAGAQPPVDAVVSLSGPERSRDLDATAALARLGPVAHQVASFVQDHTKG